MNTISVWLYPAMGALAVLWVVVIRKELADPKNKRQRIWRWLMPFWIATVAAQQVLSVLKDTENLALPIFGFACSVGALVMYVSYVRGWLADDDTVTGG